MANPELVGILKQGADAWNHWRAEANPDRIDLSGADLKGIDLTNTFLSGSNLTAADLRGANCAGASLSDASMEDVNLEGASLHEAFCSRAWLQGARMAGADLSRAELSMAVLTRAVLTDARLDGAILNRASLAGADLSGASLTGIDGRWAIFATARLRRSNLRRGQLASANFSGADLSDAIIEDVDLSGAILLAASLRGARFTNCQIHGVSAWNVDVEGAVQSGLVITRSQEPTITVDNLEVAQFLYLLLNNRRVRSIIDTITSKVVLILGRFIAERKVILDAIREDLKRRDYLPVIFDFDRPATRDTHETITTLARMARFVVADITDPRSIPQELVSIVQELPSLPVQPLLQEGSEPWGMYDHIRRYPWVLAIFTYSNLENLLANLGERVIKPAEAAARKQTETIGG